MKTAVHQTFDDVANDSAAGTAEMVFLSVRSLTDATTGCELTVAEAAGNFCDMSEALCRWNARLRLFTSGGRPFCALGAATRHRRVT